MASHYRMTWTTQDEIDFLRALGSHNKLRHSPLSYADRLRLYRPTIAARSVWPKGCDPDEILAWVDDQISKEVRHGAQRGGRR